MNFQFYFKSSMYLNSFLYKFSFRMTAKKSILHSSQQTQRTKQHNNITHLIKRKKRAKIITEYNNYNKFK